jgi:hypothetical protein
MRVLWRSRSPAEPNHELIWFLVSIGSFVGSAVWLVLALPWPSCPFLSITGFPCLTCGATRCAIALFHGDLLSALRWNPLVFIGLCGVLVFDIYAAIVLIGRLPRLRIVDWTTTGKKVAGVITISLVALNWVYLLAHHHRF